MCMCVHTQMHYSGCAGIFFTLFLLAETKKTDAEDAAAAAKDAIRTATLKRKVRARKMTTISVQNKDIHRAESVSDGAAQMHQHIVEVIDGGLEDDESGDEL